MLVCTAEPGLKSGFACLPVCLSVHGIRQTLQAAFLAPLPRCKGVSAKQVSHLRSPPLPALPASAGWNTSPPLFIMWL